MNGFNGTGEWVLSEDTDPPAKIYLRDDFLSKPDADRLFTRLLAEIPWIQRSDRYGLQPRLTYWCGPFPYSYSGLTHQAENEWHPVLDQLRARLNTETGSNSFNSVLCNLYRDNKENVDWHSDDEPSLGQNPYIGSISLGAVRPFQMRRKVPLASGDRPQISWDLSHGSLLIMEGSVQEYWQHRLPAIDEECGPRINLTFRTIY